MTLLLARHAETVWHEENRYAGGASDPDLTDEGRAQTERLARWAVARGVTAVVSSPQDRAIATATPAAAALGVVLEQCADLREVGFGSAEGHTLDELDPAVAAAFRADPVAHPFPGAEPPAEAARRCVDGLRAIAAARPDDTVLVVAHKSLLRMGLCALLGLPLARYRQVFPRLDNVAITEIALRADPEVPAALLSFNTPVSAKEPT
jgi:broad specificity phosphatase PhoE